MFCDMSTKEIDFGLTCKNEYKLPTDVMFNTSLWGVCALDYKHACKGDESATSVCDNKKKIKDNLCASEKISKTEICKDKDHKFAKCGKNWKDCLANTDFFFCEYFPSIC